MRAAASEINASPLLTITTAPCTERTGSTDATGNRTGSTGSTGSAGIPAAPFDEPFHVEGTATLLAGPRPILGDRQAARSQGDGLAECVESVGRTETVGLAAG